MWKQKLEVAARYLTCLAAFVGFAAVARWIVSVNTTTSALYFLLVVLAAATRWGLPESIFASVAGMLAFNFFFLPPVGTFTVRDPENWVALFAFLVTAVTASQLSSRARHRAQEALLRRNEISKLYELSRALLMEEGSDGPRTSVLRAEQVLLAGPIAFFDAAAGQVYGTLPDARLSLSDMSEVVTSGAALTRHGAAIIPVRMGTRVIGSLAATVDGLSLAVLESVAGLLAINYEREAALARAAAAEILRRNEEFKSSLLDGLAHDLKTPLTAIRTCVTRLITIPPRTEEVRQELLSIIDQESVRLQESITDAVELARIESNTLRLDREPCDVAALVAEVVSDSRDEAKGRYVLRVNPGITLHIDRGLFRRALAQVLENARKYSSHDSPVEIEAVEAGGAVTIRVLDRGGGIGADELGRVFEKFYRSRKVKDKVEGTGMGLAIARSIVSAHGGTIRAEQRAGGGTVIVFTMRSA